MVKFYAICACIMSCLEILDNVSNLVTSGEVSLINFLVAPFEMFWILVSIVAIFVLRSQKTSTLSPIFFLGYIGIASIFIMLNGLPLPTWFYVFILLAAGAYFLINVSLLKQSRS